MLNYSYDYEKKNAIIYPDNKPEKITLANHFSSVVATDKLGRNLTKTTTSNGLNITNTNDYLESGYYDYCNRLIKDRTTPYISKVTQTVNNISQSSDYTYDKNGNITQILSSSGNIYYTYDALNRLKQEDNRILGKTFTFNYDVGGNITSKTIVTGGVTTTIPYTYNNSWKDQLTSYNGQSISYDNMGNPTNYLGNTLTWTRGRMLASFGAYTYSYNANGIRTQKVVNGITHKYTLEGSKILREDRVSSNGTDSLIYYYDLDGIIGFGLKKQGESIFTQYYYTKNLQGDITAIYNNSGAKLASYTYDAWGNITVGININNLANINPFRYRSYYWDSETNLYYLNSRNYDSNVGRFINADDVFTPSTSVDDLGDKNLYSYCENDPINSTDNDGGFWFRALVGAVVGAVVSGVSKIVSNTANGKKWSDGLAGSMVGGATAGAIGFVTGNSALASYAGAAAESAVNEIESYIKGEK